MHVHLTSNLNFDHSLIRDFRKSIKIREEICRTIRQRSESVETKLTTNQCRKQTSVAGP